MVKWASCAIHTFPSITTESLNQVSIPIVSVKFYRQFSYKLGSKNMIFKIDFIAFIS